MIVPGQRGRAQGEMPAVKNKTKNRLQTSLWRGRKEELTEQKKRERPDGEAALFSREQRLWGLLCWSSG